MNTVRKPDKSEVEEPQYPCPHCDQMVPEMQLDCPECKNTISYCIASVSVPVLHQTVCCLQC